MAKEPNQPQPGPKGPNDRTVTRTNTNSSTRRKPQNNKTPRPRANTPPKRQTNRMPTPWTRYTSPSQHSPEATLTNKRHQVLRNQQDQPLPKQTPACCSHADQRHQHQATNEMTDQMTPRDDKPSAQLWKTQSFPSYQPAPAVPSPPTRPPAPCTSTPSLPLAVRLPTAATNSPLR